MKYKLLKLPVFEDKRGGLCSIEFSKLPFKPKRVYFIYGASEKRGGHAHTKEKEVFVCVQGSFTAKIHDGKGFHTFKMNKPGSAIYTANLVWHEFENFSKDAIMLALSGTLYDGRKGYIEDFARFLKIYK